MPDFSRYGAPLPTRYMTMAFLCAWFLHPLTMRHGKRAQDFSPFAHSLQRVQTCQSRPQSPLPHILLAGAHCTLRPHCACSQSPVFRLAPVCGAQAGVTLALCHERVHCTLGAGICTASWASEALSTPPRRRCASPILLPVLSHTLCAARGVPGLKWYLPIGTVCT